MFSVFKPARHTSFSSYVMKTIDYVTRLSYKRELSQSAHDRRFGVLPTPLLHLTANRPVARKMVASRSAPGRRGGFRAVKNTPGAGTVLGARLGQH